MNEIVDKLTRIFLFIYWNPGLRTFSCQKAEKLGCTTNVGGEISQLSIMAEVKESCDVTIYKQRPTTGEVK